MTWNIKHGGSAGRAPGIVDHIRSHNPDIAIITEARKNESAGIVDDLIRCGWRYSIMSDAQENENSILIISKEMIKKYGDAPQALQAKQRWLCVEHVNSRFKIVGVHVPGAGDKWGKANFWKAILDYSALSKDQDIALAGDFNTGRDEDSEGEPFALSHCIDELCGLGWVDVWRHLYKNKSEYSWYSFSKNGFRLDHIYIPEHLADKIKDAYYSHEARLSNISDHSSLQLVLTYL